MKICLWGDSIAKGVVFDENRGRYCLAAGRCERVLSDHGLVTENHARMGATVEAGYADFLATPTEPGIVVAIEYGGNDCDMNWQEVATSPRAEHEARTPVATFSEVLRLFVKSVLERGATPVLVLPPPLLSARYFAWVCRNANADGIFDYLGDVERIGRWHARYVQAIREVADSCGCALLDLYTPFLDARDFPGLMCRDGIHPNDRGQELMARIALERARALAA